MSIAMWGKALRRMPRLTPEEWRDLDAVSRWLIVTRAAVLIMTLMPCLLAGVLASAEHKLNPLLWVVVTLGLMAAHATNNLLNDLTDHLKGTDGGDYFRTQYGLQPLEHGVLTMRQFIGYAVVTGAFALACGGYLLAVRSGHVLPLFGAGIFFVLFYTYPLKYYGFGEVAVIIVWGPLMVGGAHYVVTGNWSWPAVLIGTVYALGPTQVIFGKHIDKLAADGKKKIRTLPVILGEPASRVGVMAMVVLQYVAVGVLIALHMVPWTTLIVLVNAKLVLLMMKVYRHPRPERMPRRFFADVWPLWFVAFAFLHSARFGALFILGIFLGRFLPA